MTTHSLQPCTHYVSLQCVPPHIHWYKLKKSSDAMCILCICKTMNTEVGAFSTVCEGASLINYLAHLLMLQIV